MRTLVAALAAAVSLFAPSAQAQTAPAFDHSCSAPSRVGYVGCFSIVNTAVQPQVTASPSSPPSGYGPADLQSAYLLPSSSAGTGATVAIVDAYDDPNAEADLATYRAQYGLSACTTANGCFTKVDQNGGTSYPVANAGWAEEISLDLDMVSAACPKCHITLVEANDNSLSNLGTAVDEAVALGADYVSNSYGGSEFSSETAYDGYYDHPGVAITVSAGDNGYGATYPAASPYVTAVGGTSLTRDASARGFTETAWSGTGSGCSAYEAKPSWQTDSGCSNRTVADVSAVADPSTGVAVYDTYSFGGWGVFGGTSASAPIIAAAYALAGSPTAGSNPAAYPYADQADLNDPSGGSNGSCGTAYFCTAGAGFDGPTGLGTPSGVWALMATPPAPPTAPTGLAASPVSANEIDLTWDASAADSYKLERSTDGTAWTTVALVSAGATSYHDTSLQASTSYLYRLRAMFTGRTSNPSTQASATTLSPPPTYSLQVTLAGSGGSVSSSPAGITCGGTCSASFATGSQVVLTATPDGSSAFAGWSGAGCSGLGTCTVTMSQAQSVAATFAPDTGPTPVSGSIAVDTTWSTDHSPYVLTGAVTVQSGVTLTIDPGVVVVAQGHYTLQINGRLLAQGSQTLPISFTCTAQSAGCWNGIAFGSSQNGSILDHLEIAYATTGLSTSTNAWTLSNSRVHDNTTGVSAIGSALCCTGTLTGNLVDHNQTGVSVFFALGEFDDNTVTQNTTGLSLLGQGDEIHDNNILANTTWNATTCFYPGSTVVDAGSNWWGTTDASQIASSICDQVDHPSQPLISTAPVASSAIAAAPQLLSTSLAGSGTGTISSDLAGIDCGTQCWALFGTGQTITLTATPDGSSVFTGWSGGGCSGTGNCQVSLNAATSVQATFTPIYTLSLDESGSGTGSVTSSPAGIDCGTACSAQFVSGTGLTLTPTPDPGSRFAGWTGGGCSGTGPCQMTISAAANITASFVRVYQLSLTIAGAGAGSIDSQPAGMSCVADCSAGFDNGQVVTLSASPAANARFAGWSGACSGTGNCQVTMSGDTAVTATFVQNYQLLVTKTGLGGGTVSSLPAAIDCGTSCAAGIDAGTDVTLTATADASSVFLGWSGGGCSGTGDCQVTMNSAVSVTASFAATSRPDGLIAYGSGAYLGNNVYSATGAGEIKAEKTARGHGATFHWRIQNDGVASDVLKLKGADASPGFTLRYLIGKASVTKAVLAGTLTKTLAPGASVTITVKITVASNAKLNVSKSALLSVTSARTGRKDAVVAKVTAVS